MIPTNFIAAVLAFLPGIDPSALRQELDATPWRPAPGVSAPAKAATESTATKTAQATPAATPVQAQPQAATTNPVKLDAQGSWQLQLAALANPDVARREQIRLEKELGEGSVSVVLENGLSKLRWGRFKSREAAEAGRAELRTHQLDGFAVKSP